VIGGEENRSHCTGWRKKKERLSPLLAPRGCKLGKNKKGQRKVLERDCKVESINDTREGKIDQSITRGRQKKSWNKTQRTTGAGNAEKIIRSRMSNGRQRKKA